MLIVLEEERKIDSPMERKRANRRATVIPYCGNPKPGLRAVEVPRRNQKADSKKRVTFARSGDGTRVPWVTSTRGKLGVHWFFVHPTLNKIQQFHPRGTKSYKSVHHL